MGIHSKTHSPSREPAHQGTLVTLRSDGRPQLSNILYLAGPDHTARISVTDSRAKTTNLRRDPRASLHVTSKDFWSYVVLDGMVELSPVADTVHDRVVEELVAMYRQAQGEHPDWDEFRRAMVDRGPPGGHPDRHRRLRAGPG